MLLAAQCRHTAQTEYRVSCMECVGTCMMYASRACFKQASCSPCCTAHHSPAMPAGPCCLSDCAGPAARVVSVAELRLNRRFRGRDPLQRAARAAHIQRDTQVVGPQQTNIQDVRLHATCHAYPLHDACVVCITACTALDEALLAPQVIKGKVGNTITPVLLHTPWVLWE
jgi:hypothetical protein